VAWRDPLARERGASTTRLQPSVGDPQFAWLAREYLGTRGVVLFATARPIRSIIWMGALGNSGGVLKLAWPEIS
jgi:hypothetical protein